MKMVLPFPDDVSISRSGAAVIAKLGEATLTVYPIVPLPFDLLGWRNATLTGGIGDAEVKLVAEEQAVTAATGWPVNLFVSDVLRGGAVIERRLHAFYVLMERGAVAVLSGKPDAVGVVAAQARDLMIRAVPDLQEDGVATLDQLFAGFELPTRS